MYKEAGSTGYDSGEKIAGQESSLCSKNTTAATAKYEGQFYQRGGDEEAVEDENYEGHSEEDQINNVERTLKIDGGRQRCWQLTVKRHGSIQKRRR